MKWFLLVIIAKSPTYLDFVLLEKQRTSTWFKMVGVVADSVMSHISQKVCTLIHALDASEDSGSNIRFSEECWALMMDPPKASYGSLTRTFTWGVACASRLPLIRADPARKAPSEDLQVHRLTVQSATCEKHSYIHLLVPNSPPCSLEQVTRTECPVLCTEERWKSHGNSPRVAQRRFAIMKDKVPQSVLYWVLSTQLYILNLQLFDLNLCCKHEGFNAMWHNAIHLGDLRLPCEPAQRRYQ